MSVKGSKSASSDDTAAGRPGPKETTRPAKPRKKEEEPTRYNTRWDIRAAKTGKGGSKGKSPDKTRDGT